MSVAAARFRPPEWPNCAAPSWSLGASPRPGAGLSRQWWRTPGRLSPSLDGFRWNEDHAAPRAPESPNSAGASPNA
jgi:hypothetical protein